MRSRRTHATASDTQDQEDLVTTAREEEHIAVRAARRTLGRGDPAMLDREGRHTLARVVAPILAPAALCTADPEDLPMTVLEVSLIPVLEVPLIPVLADHASQDRADPATQAQVAETPAPGFAGRSHPESHRRSQTRWASSYLLRTGQTLRWPSMLHQPHLEPTVLATTLLVSRMMFGP